jgi:hypothetical protein
MLLLIRTITFSTIILILLTTGGFCIDSLEASSRDKIEIISQNYPGQYPPGGMRHRGGMMGPGGGMSGNCPFCGQPWQGQGIWDGKIPDKLPTPKSKEWVSRLQDVIKLEHLSYEQYTADSKKFGIIGPYNIIIPQESMHIEWINSLFKAYRLTPYVGKLQIKQSKSIYEAVNIARNLEQDLISKYPWLIQNAGDDTSSRVLEYILVQSRMHYTMFSHFLEMHGQGSNI